MESVQKILYRKYDKKKKKYKIEIGFLLCVIEDKKCGYRGCYLNKKIPKDSNIQIHCKYQDRTSIENQCNNYNEDCYYKLKIVTTTLLLDNPPEYYEGIKWN